MKRILMMAAVLLMTGVLYAEEGWKPLFNADLSNADYDAKVWSVTPEGWITAASDAPLWTKAEYENFELSLEFKSTAHTNSGVLVYGTDKVNWIPCTVELQILGGKDDESKELTIHDCGAIYGHVAPSKYMVKPAGEWNQMKVRCVGPMVTVWVNGEQVSQADLRQYTSATKNPDGSDIPSWLTVPMAKIPNKGFIGFQGKHGNAWIFFRNIQIRDVK